tara:strand:- start:341 stop:541 length:201 start_codon:yes stop_codon:yes gene_type:complete
MKSRMHMLMSYFTGKSKVEKREKLMNKELVKAVDQNAHGTSGYTLKSGPNKGKVLKHNTVKHPNKL